MCARPEISTTLTSMASLGRSTAMSCASPTNPLRALEQRAIYSGFNTAVKTLNLHQAAAFLHMHPEEVRSRAKRGLIPGAKVGRRWVFLRG